VKQSISLITVLLILLSVNAQQKIGAFDGNEDVGNPLIKGSATYNSKMQDFNLECGGKNMWAKDDQFLEKNKGRFYYQCYCSLYWQRNRPAS
jgi:TolB protein